MTPFLIEIVKGRPGTARTGSGADPAGAAVRRPRISAPGQLAHDPEPEGAVLGVTEQREHRLLEPGLEERGEPCPAASRRTADGERLHRLVGDEPGRGVEVPPGDRGDDRRLV